MEIESLDDSITINIQDQEKDDGTGIDVLETGLNEKGKPDHDRMIKYYENNVLQSYRRITWLNNLRYFNNGKITRGMVKEYYESIIKYYDEKFKKTSDKKLKKKIAILTKKVQFILGFLYQQGYFDKSGNPDYTMAEIYYKESATNKKIGIFNCTVRGNAKAQIYLGILYAEGKIAKNGKPDLVTAKKYFELAGLKQDEEEVCSPKVELEISDFSNPSNSGGYVRLTESILGKNIETETENDGKLSSTQDLDEKDFSDIKIAQMNLKNLELQDIFNSDLHVDVGPIEYKEPTLESDQFLIFNVLKELEKSHQKEIMKAIDFEQTNKTKCWLQELEKSRRSLAVVREK